MALDLATRILNETRYQGDVTLTIPAEKFLRIETTPGGEEILNVQCPVGKQWEALIFVQLIEVDA